MTDSKKSKRARTRRRVAELKATDNIPPGGELRVPDGALFTYFGDALMERFAKRQEDTKGKRG